ncbi:NAD-dependent histone deacetylase [Martiniozyma asiatica (nom. inval.)]|nr:NAD-dependent histone deacetylase [Martiniozyma asiatica]
MGIGIKLESQVEDFIKREIKTEQNIQNEKEGVSIHSLQSDLSTLLSHYKLDSTLPSPFALGKTTFRKPKRPVVENNTILDLDALQISDFLEQIEPGYNISVQAQDKAISMLHHAFKFCKKAVVVTGAGISTGAGIPDFRSRGGLFDGFGKQVKDSTLAKSNKGKELFDYNVFRTEDGIEKFENMIEKLYFMIDNALPTSFHHSLNDMSGQGRLLRLYTQNIDALELDLQNLKRGVDNCLDDVNSRNGKDKAKAPQTIQLHGNIKWMNCSKCSYMTPLTADYFKKSTVKIEDSKSELDNNNSNRKLLIPCPSCIEMSAIRELSGLRATSCGHLRPSIVLYNEFHPQGHVIGSITEKDLNSKPDCLIITGTTLKIPGVRRLVKEMAKSVRKQKGYVIWMGEIPNESILKYIGGVDLIVKGDCQIVPNLIKWWDHVDHTKKLEKGIKPQKRKLETLDNSIKKQKI